jgi:hypothetical protein
MHGLSLLLRRRHSDRRGASLSGASDGRMMLASTEALWREALEALNGV